MPKTTIMLTKDEIAEAIIEKYGNESVLITDVKFKISDTADDRFSTQPSYELTSADVVISK